MLNVLGPVSAGDHLTEQLGNVILTFTFKDTSTNQTSSRILDHVMDGDQSSANKSIGYTFTRAADFIIGKSVFLLCLEEL